jgi:hypothetical protein
VLVGLIAPTIASFGVSATDGRCLDRGISQVQTLPPEAAAPPEAASEQLAKA